ncbi:MAG: transporter-related protein [Bacillales bacterium]|jgi:NitT/TauT family transport system ATP-binding protein|nr:transporter-related protein [Bacillales bacterium]
MSLLKIDKITQVFFSNEYYKVVLDNVNLVINDNEFVAFLGPSGCGKTTLLSIISGLLKPTMGNVFLKNAQIEKPTNRIGYMLQQDFLYPWRTIQENIVIGLEINNLKNPENTRYALDLLKQVGLKDVEKDYPQQLSGGMRQRVALVRTLATQPEILLLDEPFSALDYQTKIKLEELVFHTLKQFKKSAILVTHDIEEAIAVCDRIYIFNKDPGTIAHEIIIPEDLRKSSPFNARQHPEFAKLFDHIWKEMEKLG